jgi:hypothetical protein
MNRKLDIIITNDECLNHISGLIKAAAEKNCDLSVFLTDKGVFMTENKEFVFIVQKYKNSISGVSVCEHSCKVNGVGSRIDGFNYASQFENAKTVSGMKKNGRVLLF